MAKASKKATTARSHMSRKHPEESTSSVATDQGLNARTISELATAPREPSDREPTDDEVARRAYEIYVSRGQEPGRHVEDWLQARRELSALRGRGPTA